ARRRRQSGDRARRSDSRVARKVCAPACRNRSGVASEMADRGDAQAEESGSAVRTAGGNGKVPCPTTLFRKPNSFGKENAHYSRIITAAKPTGSVHAWSGRSRAQGLAN